MAALMRKCLVLGAIAFLAGLGTHASPAAAAVVVVDNHTAAKIEFTIRPRGQQGKTITRWRPATWLPIPTTGPVGLRFLGWKIAALTCSSPIASIISSNGDQGIDLKQMFLEAEGEKSRAAAKPVAQPPGAGPAGSGKTPSIRSRSRSWPTTMNRGSRRSGRNGFASGWRRRPTIFEHHCRVRFQVVAVGSWSSDAKNFMFEKALADFEQKVRPAPGAAGHRLYRPVPMAARRTARRRHPQPRCIPTSSSAKPFPGASEAERLEFLVHEMGHLPGRRAYGRTPPRSCVPFWGIGVQGR